jgi:hypothetical protein
VTVDGKFRRKRKRVDELLAKLIIAGLNNNTAAQPRLTDTRFAARARYPRVATAGGSSSLNFTPKEKMLMLVFAVPV